MKRARRTLPLAALLAILFLISADARSTAAQTPDPATPDAAAAPNEGGAGGAAVDPVVAALEVDTRVEPASAPLGVEVVWTTRIGHPDGAVGFAGPATGGAMHVKSREITAAPDGKASTARVVLTGLTLGSFTLPPLELRFTDDAGVDHPFQVLGGKVEIVATTEENAQPADLAPPVEITAWNPWFFAGIAVGLLVLGGFFYWVRHRGRRRALLPPAPTDLRTPGQIALDAIFELQTQGLLERREIKLFTYQLDDIVRAFLVATTGVGSLTETSEEFLRSLTPAMGRDRLAEVRAFFDQSDRVRFAGEEHEAAEASALVERAIHLVHFLSGTRAATGDTAA